MKKKFIKLSFIFIFIWDNLESILFIISLKQLARDIRHLIYSFYH